MASLILAPRITLFILILLLYELLSTADHGVVASAAALLMLIVDLRVRVLYVSPLYGWSWAYGLANLYPTHITDASQR